jgi:hypothetical protein
MNNQCIEPNLFELKGDRTRITYSSTSFIGLPQLNYQHGNQNLNFTGDEIRSLKIEIGLLLTVTLDQIPDLKTDTLTLLLPTVNLPEINAEERIHTIAILTTQRTSIGGPCLVKGQIDTYKTIELKGIARQVIF